MLAFSRTNRLDLLPALPVEWPEGTLRGLRVRGGCLVDLAWSQGRLVLAQLRAERATSITVRYAGKAVPIHLSQGDVIAWMDSSRPQHRSRVATLRKGPA